MPAQPQGYVTKWFFVQVHAAKGGLTNFLEQAGIVWLDDCQGIWQCCPMQQKHATQIIEALTADVLKRELGMSDRAIRHAKSSGSFAALWYRPLKELCESHGIYCPLDAFNWKLPAKNSGKQAKSQTKVKVGNSTVGAGAAE